MPGNVLTEGGDLVVYPDKQKMLRRLNLRAFFILLPVAVGIFVVFAYLRQLMPAPVPLAIATEFTFLPWFVVVLYFVVYVATLATIQRQNRPIVTISPEGLTIHTVATQIGMLRWDEIAEVKPYTFIYRYVGIVPHDPKGLCRRLGSHALLIRLNAWCVPLYRLFGVFVAPINIPQEYLLMSADELAAIIRDHRPSGPPRPAEAGVWPPPPLRPASGRRPRWQDEGLEVMTTPPDTPENALAGVVNAVDNEALRALIRGELDRLDPAARAVVARRLREQSEYRLREGRRSMEATHPPPVVAEPLPPAQMVRALVGACIVVLGFAFFWYGMVFGTPSHTASAGQPSATWQIVRFAWCALLTWMLVRDLRGGRLREAWAVARQVTPWVLAQNVVVIAVTVALGLTLLRLFPALDRSWLYLLPGTGGHAGNLGLMPVQIKYFGIAFLLLFAVSIPELAKREETQYRQGTKDWRHGLWRSLRFGLAHCVVGVPLYGGLALTVGGLWFTFQYFRGGVERSTLHHAVYNWIIVSAALMAAILWSLHP